MRRSLTFILSALALLPLGLPVLADSITLQQGSTARKIVFLLVQSADHVSALTGATPTVTLSKNGGAFAAPAGTVAELGSGWYVLTPTSADTGTVGALIVHATATNADPYDVVNNVVAYNPDSSSNLGLSALPSAAPAASGGLPTIGTGSGQVNPSGGTYAGVSLASTQAFNNTGQTSAPAYYTAPYTPAQIWGLDLSTGFSGTVAGSVLNAANAAAQTAATNSGSAATSGSANNGILTTLQARIPGTVQPQTGDAFARLGAPSGASVDADVLTRLASSAIPANFGLLAINGSGLVTSTNGGGGGSSVTDSTVQADVVAALNTVLPGSVTAGSAYAYLQALTPTSIANATLAASLAGKISLGRAVAETYLNTAGSVTNPSYSGLTSVFPYQWPDGAVGYTSTTVKNGSGNVTSRTNTPGTLPN